jgi:murein DD-endopeptidase MepM/ murein hydrolase activator NlpD
MVSVNPLNEDPATGIYTLRVAAKRFPTRRLRVAPAFVDPPAESAQRIVAENDRLDAVFKTTTWRESVGPFQAPVTATGRNTFGARSIFNGRPRQPHGGVDFGSPIGTPVVAPAPAVVALAEDLYFTGRTVILDHGQGLYSVLAHLSSIAVAEGDSVERGAVVGEVGATGRVTGPHLHWGTRLQGARVDPLSLLAVLPPTPD